MNPICIDCEKLLTPEDETYTRLMGFDSYYCIDCGNIKHSFNVIIGMEHEDANTYV
jgi:hypothetical protein